MDRDTLELLKTKVFVTAPEFVPTPESPPADAAIFAPQEADDALLAQQLAAQAQINAGQIGEAVAAYGALIQKGQRLEEVIEDLSFAAEKFPKEISILQTLGDAYAQANQFQEALDAYTKAESLLR
jgi:tetratricopeptide (TPR) repeat protein